MKRYWWLILLTFIVVAAVIWWKMPNSSLKQGAVDLAPELDVAMVSITDIDGDRIKLKSRVILFNNLPVELNTNKLNYDVYIDSVKVVESSYTEPIRIESSRKDTIEMPMEILAEPMKQVLKSFEEENRDSATYTMKASFQVDVPIAGNRDFKMTISRRLPAFRVPSGELEDVDVHKLGFKESSLDIDLIIDNKNIFPLKLKDGRYTMAIDNDLELEGALDKEINIPAKSKTPISMNLVIKTAKVGRLFWKALFEKKNTDFVFNFKGKLDSNNELLDNTNLAMKITGTLDELKKGVKKLKE